MRILAVGGTFFVLLLGMTGCHCNTYGDRYSDLIDDISDYKAEWEFLYNPALDISRIGQPDWCRSKWNRWLCPCACEASGYCPQCDAVHFVGPGEEIPESEARPVQPEESEMPPALPLELPPEPGKLKSNPSKDGNLPLELPPKPGKKSGYPKMSED